MKNNKNKVQFLLNEYLETHGDISLILPDGVQLQIGITQDGPKGPERHSEYCWITTSRDDRRTLLDRYTLTIHYNNQERAALTQEDQGTVTII